MGKMEQQAAKNASPSSSDPKIGIPEIHAHEAHRKYRLIDLDNSATERTAAELFEGSKLLENRALWFSNFRTAVSQVQEWCAARSNKIVMAFIEVRSNKVQFYFITTSDQYDLDLGNQMTALEVQLDGSAGIGYVETLQVPARSIDRFVGDQSMLVWKYEQPNK
jgi:hypothetical protein